MTEKIKVTRKLSNFNFENEGAAVALVGPAVGGGANSRTTLVYKSKATDEVTTEQVEKASMVTVTLTITEYLRKFFDMWYDDAELLARIMGYDTTVEPTEYVDNWYDNYLDEKVAAVSIMKSLVLDKEQDEINKAVTDLTPSEYLTVLKSQEQFEKNYEKLKPSLKKSSSVVAEGVTAPSGAISPSVEPIEKNEDLMPEHISKSALQSLVDEAVTKAVSSAQVELQKAKDIIATYEQEKQEVVAKSRKTAISTVEADEASAAELFKSLESLPDSAFESVIKALKKKSDALETSDILKEVGGNAKEIHKESGAPEVNRTLEILKSQLPKEGAQ